MSSYTKYIGLHFHARIPNRSGSTCKILLGRSVAERYFVLIEEGVLLLNISYGGSTQ